MKSMRILRSAYRKPPSHWNGLPIRILRKVRV